MPKQANGTTNKKPLAPSAEVHAAGDAAMMAVSPQKHSLSPRRRRALELPANSPNGATRDSLVQAHGITRDIIAGLVRAALELYARDRQGRQQDDQGQALPHHDRRRLALEGWPATLIHPAR